MGWNMCAPSGANFDHEEKDKGAKFKEMGDGRFKVKFITQKKKEHPTRSDFLKWGYQKGENSPDRFEQTDNASVFSTKAGTVKDNGLSSIKGYTSNQSNTSLMIEKRHIWDDWEMLDEHYGIIKAIGIFTTYYVKGIQIYFETDDLQTICQRHCAKDFDPDKDSKINYKEILLEDGELIERIIWVKSTQTNFIRSITIGTSFGRNVCVEGEIEVHDLLQAEPERRPGYSGKDPQSYENPDSHTFIHKDSYDLDEENFTKKHLGYKSILLEGDDEIDDLDKLKVRKQSVIDSDLKTHIINLKYMNQYVVGFRSLFNCDYLEDLEVYTEQNEDIKMNTIDN